MKNYKTIIAAIVAGLALSAAQKSQAAFSIDASLLNQTLYSTLPATSAPDGTVSSWVLSDYGADTTGLTFVYQIYNSGPDTVTAASFNGFGSGVVLSTSTLASLAGLTGSATGTVNFTFNSVTTGGAASFDGSLPQTDTSYLLIIETSATTWSGNIGKEEDDFQAAGSILAPVPEPSTIVAGALMLLPLGVGALRAVRKERKA